MAGASARAMPGPKKRGGQPAGNIETGFLPRMNGAGRAATAKSPRARAQFRQRPVATLPDVGGDPAGGLGLRMFGLGPRW